jgi:hypothetical protein
MLFTEKIAAYSKNFTGQIYVIYGQNAESFNVKTGGSHSCYCVMTIMCTEGVGMWTRKNWAG